MIEEIVIRDLGVISEAKLEFGPGLTVLTGETGAGKTMVLNALGLLLGERSDSTAIRQGQPQTYVEGRWLLPDSIANSLREQDIELEDNELILSRSVSSEGRSKATVSARSVPVSLLSEIGSSLVVVHGQADQIRLKSSSAQREALDQFAGEELAATLSSYREIYSNWREVEKRLNQLVSEFDSRAREANDIRAAVEELDALDPKPNEDVELAELAERLTHTEDLRLAAIKSHEELNSESFEGTSDALGQIASARRALESVSQHDPKLAELAEQLREIGVQVNEVAAGIASFLASLEGEGEMHLDRIQERRSQLLSAMRRFGPSLDDVIAYRDSAGARLLELDSSSEEIEKLTASQKQLSAEAQKLADKLTSLRTVSARKLSDAVTAELASLAMGGASLVVEVSPVELGPTGGDQIAMLLSAYPGAEPRPLGKGASGGELSRIMLAIEVVLAQSESAPTFIFDEVDAGVGGAAATEVGKRLGALAKNAQVIVVTHLPQVAAFASRHLRVLKNSDGSFTASDVVRLEGEDVVSEITRMLSGLSDSESGRSHAKELLDLARSELAS